MANHSFYTRDHHHPPYEVHRVKKDDWTYQQVTRWVDNTTLGFITAVNGNWHSSTTNQVYPTFTDAVQATIGGSQ